MAVAESVAAARLGPGNRDVPGALRGHRAQMAGETDREYENYKVRVEAAALGMSVGEYRAEMRRALARRPEGRSSRRPR